MQERKNLQDVHASTAAQFASKVEIPSVVDGLCSERVITMSAFRLFPPLHLIAQGGIEPRVDNVEGSVWAGEYHTSWGAVALQYATVTV